jgi:HTH-type transcriptional regulator/antitoxin HigA
MKQSTASAHARVADDYLELVKRFPLRSLRTDDEHQKALRILTRILGRPDGRVSAGERDYVEVLGHLVDDYGQRRYVPVRLKHSPLQTLRFLLQQNSMSTADLGKVLGSKAAASFVLNGKRELSKSHIRKLAARFKVDPGLFL